MRRWRHRRTRKEYVAGAVACMQAVLPAFLEQQRKQRERAAAAATGGGYKAWSAMVQAELAEEMVARETGGTTGGKILSTPPSGYPSSSAAQPSASASRCQADGSRAPSAKSAKRKERRARKKAGGAGGGGQGGGGGSPTAAGAVACGGANGGGGSLTAAGGTTGGKIPSTPPSGDPSGKATVKEQPLLWAGAGYGQQRWREKAGDGLEEGEAAGGGASNEDSDEDYEEAIAREEYYAREGYRVGLRAAFGDDDFDDDLITFAAHLLLICPFTPLNFRVRCRRLRCSCSFPPCFVFPFFRYRLVTYRFAISLVLRLGGIISVRRCTQSTILVNIFGSSLPLSSSPPRAPIVSSSDFSFAARARGCSLFVGRPVVLLYIVILCPARSSHISSFYYHLLRLSVRFRVSFLPPPLVTVNVCVMT